MLVKDSNGVFCVSCYSLTFVSVGSCDLLFTVCGRRFLLGSTGYSCVKKQKFTVVVPSGEYFDFGSQVFEGVFWKFFLVVF